VILSQKTQSVELLATTSVGKKSSLVEVVSLVDVVHVFPLKSWYQRFQWPVWFEDQSMIMEPLPNWPSPGLRLKVVLVGRVCTPAQRV